MSKRKGKGTGWKHPKTGIWYPSKQYYHKKVWPAVLAEKQREQRKQQAEADNSNNWD